MNYYFQYCNIDKFCTMRVNPFLKRKLIYFTGTYYLPVCIKKTKLKLFDYI